MIRSDAQRLPTWLRLPRKKPGSLGEVRHTLTELGLATVCEGARCPNRGECYASGTATFMILGENCSRSCGFCSVPHERPEEPEPDEPARVAEAARRLGLGYVVVTSVTRDDLPDGGAGHFEKTVAALRALAPVPRVELLVPDFQGEEAAIETALSTRPDVLGHNLETVPRLYSTVRPGARYARSLDLLRRAADAGLTTKTGLMLGLGEDEPELERVYHDIARAGVGILTLGQYLRPTRDQLPVARYWRPEEFDGEGEKARRIGIPTVAAGPLVRSSYLAEHYFQSNRWRQR
ncbi:MAG: lipoyl synthase [bacterium]|nr:lipoyl synthase [bacterium]